MTAQTRWQPTPAGTALRSLHAIHALTRGSSRMSATQLRQALRDIRREAGTTLRRLEETDHD